MQRSEFWPTPSAHREYWERHNCAQVYEYDPTDDGPECETIKAIKAMHSSRDLSLERMLTKISRLESTFDFGGLWP